MIDKRDPTMNVTSGPYSITADGVQWLDASKLKRVTGEQLDNYVDTLQKHLESHYRQPLDVSDHPAYQPYATVQVNGKVVARIDNHGWAQMSNSLGSKLSGALPGDVNGQTGPVLAQKRAEIIAEMLGGTVVKAATAMTQAAFDATPQPTASTDYAAMQNDPLYQALQRAKQAETAFRTQQIAQESAANTPATGATSQADEAVDGGDSEAVRAFLDYMAKSPEERYFESFLKSKGLTQEQYDALPPDEKKALMQEFETFMKQKMAETNAEKTARTAYSELV